MAEDCSGLLESVWTVAVGENQDSIVRTVIQTPQASVSPLFVVLVIHCVTKQLRSLCMQCRE